MINDSKLNSGAQQPPAQRSEPAGPSRQLRNFGLASLGLVLCFAMPLWNLGWFAATSEFHSYILLIPFISFYLVWLKKGSFPVCSQPARKAALRFPDCRDFSAHRLLAVSPFPFETDGGRLSGGDDDLLPAVFFLHLRPVFGEGNAARDHFSIGFARLNGAHPRLRHARRLIAFLQHGSAAAAQGFFSLSVMPFLRSGLTFTLPNISLQVAPECSGIQSSMVLLITGLVAGYLFLRKPGNRALLALLMIPLALLRNGFRVFTIGELCVHIGPQMINSPIHRRGGPIFFVLSLIPLFLLLIVLQKTERARGKPKSKTGGNPNPKPPK